MTAAVFVAVPGSYRIAAYVRAARDAGLEAIVVTHANAAAVPPGTTGIAVQFDPVSTFLHTVRKALVGKDVQVVLGIDDTCIEIASILAKEFDVKQNPAETARLSTKKHLSRKHLGEAGVPVPAHALIAAQQQPSKHNLPGNAPWVVKPVDLSASRGVIRADNWSQLEAAATRSRTIALAAGGDGALLIEQYIDGDEIAVDAIVSTRGLQIIATFDKPVPLTGPFFEESIYVTPTALPSFVQTRIEQLLNKACAALGIVTGPVHAEFRIDNNGEAWILEIATRTIGGDCGNIFQALLPKPIEQLVLESAMGKSIDLSFDGAAGVCMLPVRSGGMLRRVNGIAAAEKISGVTGVSIAIREGYELTPWPEGCGYPGFVFARAQHPDQVFAALCEAADLIEFTVSPSFPVTTTSGG